MFAIFPLDFLLACGWFALEILKHSHRREKAKYEIEGNFTDNPTGFTIRVIKFIIIPSNTNTFSD